MRDILTKKMFTITKTMFSPVKLLVGVATGRAASAALSLLLSLILLRVLTKEDYGYYFFYYTIINFSSLIPGLAINSAFVFRYQHSLDRDSLLSTYVIGKIVLVLLASGVTGILWSFELISHFAAISVASGVALSLFDSALCISQAQKQFKFYAGLMPLRNILIILFIIIAFSIYKKLDLTIVMWSLLIASITLGVISIQISNKITFRKFNQKSLVELFQTTKRFIFFEGSTALLINIEIWVMGVFVADGILKATDIAEYGAGFTFAFLFPIISSSVTSILITKVKPGEHLGRNGLKMLKPFILLTFILTLAYAFFSYQATQLFIADKYHELHWLIPTICIGMYFSFCTNYARIQLLSHKTDTYINLVYSVQILFGIISSFTLIWLFGLIGATITFLIIRLFAFILIGGKFIYENIRLD